MKLRSHATAPHNFILYPHYLDPDPRWFIVHVTLVKSKDDIGHYHVNKTRYMYYRRYLDVMSYRHRPPPCKYNTLVLYMSPK